MLAEFEGETHELGHEATQTVFQGSIRTHPTRFHEQHIVGHDTYTHRPENKNQLNGKKRSKRRQNSPTRFRSGDYFFVLLYFSKFSRFVAKPKWLAQLME